jgi:hypothetical protein
VRKRFLSCSAYQSEDKSTTPFVASDSFVGRVKRAIKHADKRFKMSVMTLRCTRREDNQLEE